MSRRSRLLSLVLALHCWEAFSADQPQWGQAWSRNLVSTERRLPDCFDPHTGKNVKWSAKLGSETYSTPIIGGGKVYIGTNNEDPRDTRHRGDRGVLMCFAEQTGEFLWQLVVPKREEDIYLDWPNSGICSPVTIDGDRIYVVSNRGEVMCLDPEGMANGNDGPFKEEGSHMTRQPRKREGAEAPAAVPPLEAGPMDADIIWLFNLTEGAGIWSHDAAFSSILVHGKHLYLNTGTGVDNTHRKIRTPDAPSLVVLDKRTGKLLARDAEKIAPNIFHNTYSSPSMAEIEGQLRIFFAGGNGVVYGFEPLNPDYASDQVATLKKVWQFDFDPEGPKENVHRFNSNRRESPSNIYGMPVLHENRVYVAGGGDIWWGKHQAWLKCVDATGAGDRTANGLLWSYTLGRHVLATPAIAEGMVFIGDCAGAFHCIDIQTGKAIWTHEIRGDAWSSPFIADGKVYQGTQGGMLYAFALSRDKKVLQAMELGSAVSASPVAANGVLYVASMNRLFAVKQRD
jgi:outer membrane protein assembly factor BamB